jgi:Fe-S-cluster containining protein
VAIELDMDKFREYSTQAEDENWEFRSFLKNCEVPEHEIDNTVRRHFRDVSHEIDCTACANCCRKLRPQLEPKDIARLARAKGVSEAQFRESCVEKFNEDGERGLRFNRKPCPFLEDSRCAVYEARPDECRSYPHLHKKRFTSRLMTAVQNTTVCPISYYVFERLKMDLWHAPDDDWLDDGGLDGEWSEAEF